MSKIALALCCGIAANIASFAQAQDADNDGLPSSWEEANGLNPTLASDAGADADGDGVINLLEYVWGGDPNRADPEIKPNAGILNNQFFTISYNRRLPSSAFNIQLEHADSIPNGNWITDGFTEVSRASLNADVERLTYRLSAALTRTSRQFVRVSVRRASTQSIPEFTYHVIDRTIIHG